MKSQYLYLLLWMLVGGILRFTQLTAKPPWTDEFATMVFSLGNSFQSVPLDRVIAAEILLQPLRLNPGASAGTVASLILNEDNHPPLYFILAHLWLKLFPASGDYLSLWVARSLPALLGTLSIPPFYWLGRIAFSSPLGGQLVAAMAAVSPYSVFLSQEARHYTLAILFAIASLGCCLKAAQFLQRGISLPFWLVFSWIAANSFGLSVHYFLAIALLAEGMALAGFCYQLAPKLPKFFGKNCWRLGLVFSGTIAAGFVWIFLILPRGYGNEMTGWIGNVYWDILTALGPIFQLLSAWITMLSLLPVESHSLWIAILSGIGMLMFFIWAIPIFKRGLLSNWQQVDTQVGTKILVFFWGSATGIYLLVPYVLGIDITRGARYHFSYFPAAITLLAGSLIFCWQNGSKLRAGELPVSPALSLANWREKLADLLRRDRRSTVVIFWLMGFLSCLTVTANLGYQKYYRPEQFVALVHDNSSVPVLIATPHTSLVQTGEMMGIAWELLKNREEDKISFLLAKKTSQEDGRATLTLQKAVREIGKPLDVWAVNFQAPVVLDGCLEDSRPFPHVNGYSYHRYHCQ